ncbi:MAG TPA: hypothetical protein VMS86_03095, partial [Thermoanaerobaculia bacterium]|nr:hypothetical protein [Thermoanaerobaculia bacterium]
TRWRRDRDEKTSWSSPAIVEHEGRAQVVLSGGNFARAYDLETGEEVWPLLWGGELYMLKDVVSGNTFVSSFEAATGKPHYQDARLPQSWTIKASPVGAAGRIYLSSEEGDVIVLARGHELEVLAVNSMGEQILATPAIAGSDLFLRTRSHLWRIAE